MSENPRYPKLFEPGKIGKLTIKNRFYKSASHAGFYPYEDGQIQQPMIDYYECLAKGGVGVIIAGSGLVHFPEDAFMPRGYATNDDKYLPSHIKLAEVIKKHDCRAFMQIFTLGPMLPVAPGIPTPIAATSLPKEELPFRWMDVPKALTAEEIKVLVKSYANTADRIKRAGFDGIEINAGCKHFFNTFLSRFWNRRTDEYGGEIENRARIVVEVIQAIKERNGSDFPISVLINGGEPGLVNGLTADEAAAIAALLEKAGADAIQVRGEAYNRPKNIKFRDSTHFPDAAVYPEISDEDAVDIDNSMHGRAGWIKMAAKVKKAVSVPVIGVGRLDADLGEKYLEQGTIDFVGINRRFIADHEYVNKIKDGKQDEIIPCTACLTCFANMQMDRVPLCRINAAVGKEMAYEIKPAEVKKKVLVVGSGPAGLEAARVAALRGHEVHVYEKESKIGGSIFMAAMVKGSEREDLMSIVKYLSGQAKKLGVTVKTGKKVDQDLINKIKPDVVILAAGAKHNTPDLPGIDKKIVVTSESLHNQLKKFLRFTSPDKLHTLSNLWMPVGKKVVVMGGNIQGCQTAEFLIKRGRQVTIVDSGEEIGDGLVGAILKPRLLSWFDDKNIKTIAGVKYEEITDKGLVITDKDGKKQTLEADTIITALPLKPNEELAKAINGQVKEVYAIGDCHEPNLIVDAVAAGSAVARKI